MNNYDNYIQEWFNNKELNNKTYFATHNKLFVALRGKWVLFAVKDYANKYVLYNTCNIKPEHIERLINIADSLNYTSVYTNYYIEDKHYITAKEDFIIEACKSLLFDYYKVYIVPLLNPDNKRTHRCKINVKDIYHVEEFSKIRAWYMYHRTILESNNAYEKLQGDIWKQDCITFLSKLSTIPSTTALPSLWDCIKERIFENNSNTLYQYYLFDKYCFGKHILYKDLRKNINTPFNQERLTKALLLNHIHFKKPYDTSNLFTYIDELKLFNAIIKNTRYNNYVAAVNASRVHLEHAKQRVLARMNNDCYNDGKGFRETRCNFGHPISEKYVSIVLTNQQTYEYKYDIRTWTDYKSYKTPQLRILYKGDIYTSFGDSIRPAAFSEIIKQLYDTMKKNKKGCIITFDKELNIECTLLGGIGFTNKSLAHSSFTNNSWYVIINRHYVWLEDIISFIEDEHLVEFNYLLKYVKTKRNK